MKVLMVLLVFISSFASSEECVFDEAAYINFIHGYISSNKNAKLLEDRKSMIIQNGHEEIKVSGGGCDHLGASITVKTTVKMNEQQFLEKVLLLSEEFGSWLLDMDEVKSAIDKKSWDKVEGTYYMNLNEMTAFDAGQDDGKIIINFYIN